MCICLESTITSKLFVVLLNVTFKFGIMPSYNLLIAIQAEAKEKIKERLISNASSVSRFSILIYSYRVEKKVMYF